jgi:hypothetical protein
MPAVPKLSRRYNLGAICAIHIIFMIPNHWRERLSSKLQSRATNLNTNILTKGHPYELFEGVEVEA